MKIDTGTRCRESKRELSASCLIFSSVWKERKKRQNGQSLLVERLEVKVHGDSRFVDERSASDLNLSGDSSPSSIIEKISEVPGLFKKGKKEVGEAVPTRRVRSKGEDVQMTSLGPADEQDREIIFALEVEETFEDGNEMIGVV